MAQTIESAAVQGWGALDRHAPTADESCPRCSAPTRYRLGADEYGERIEAEQCVYCGWLAEFDDDEGGEW